MRQIKPFFSWYSFDSWNQRFCILSISLYQKHKKVGVIDEEEGESIYHTVNMESIQFVVYDRIIV